jgi:hypothetical protein
VKHYRARKALLETGQLRGPEKQRVIRERSKRKERGKLRSAGKGHTAKRFL